MAIKLLEFASWEPDQPSYGGGQTVDARNVIPVKRGYRPFPGPVATPMAAHGARALGAFSFIDQGGNVQTLGATGAHIYLAGASTWTDKGGTYTTTKPWQFAQYGDYILATNAADGPQYSTSGSGTLATFGDLTGAPNANYIAVVRDFVMLGDLASYRNGIQWGAIDAPLDWPTTGSTDAQGKQSDRQIFPSGGKVMAVVGGLASVDGLIFLEHAVYRATYVGPPLIFQFDLIERQQGTPAPYSVVRAGGFALYLGEDGWHKTDGVNSIGIGADRVDQWFKMTVDPVRREEVRGALDPMNSVAVWIFPSTSAPSGLCDMFMVYNYVADKWSYGALTTEFIYQHHSAAATLESLNAYGPLDDLPFSLDSNAFRGGVLSLGVYGSDHKLATLTGTPLAASVTTGETGGTRIMATGVRPLVDGAEASCSVLTRDVQSALPSLTDCAATSTFDGIAYCHISTRYVRARVEIEAGAGWTNCPAVELHYEDEGTI